MTSTATDLTWLRGASVLVTGARVSGLAVVRPLLDLGAEVTVTDSNGAALGDASNLGVAAMTQDELLADSALLAGFSLVVTSPGFRPDSPVLAAATEQGIPVWGDVELSWQIDRAEVYGPAARWLVVTGTNGKTTTTSMVASILAAAGVESVACGNIGLPIADALRRTPHPRVLAVELSSFQLFWAPSVRPAAGVVLNIAEDHLDWHGGMDNYVQAKARALTGDVAVVGLDDAKAASLSALSPAARVVGFRLGEPGSGELGVRSATLVDNAFADNAELIAVGEVEPSGPAGVLDALAAAALVRSIGVEPADVRTGLQTYRVGPHRAALVREIGGVRFVDDSKATNPHAARSSILAHDRVVWIAGGLLKGAVIDDLVVEIADRLVAAVVLGRDGMQIAEALGRHAPNVPVVRLDSGDDTGVSPEAEDADAVMRAVVARAAGYAAPGDTVLLAPAAASLDMFADYGHRGRSFTESVLALGAADIGPTKS